MKLISLNIEGKAHLERVTHFLRNESPDVFCLQEIFREDFEYFETLGYTGIFLPMTLKDVAGIKSEIGIALYSRNKIIQANTFYYSHTLSSVPIFDKDDIPNSVLPGVIIADIECAGKTFSIATTHFTWTPEGSHPCTEQKEDMGIFLTHIEKLPPHVICGDFNIPRNINSLYPELTKHYTDTIPLQYSSSLDKTLHRLGNDSDKERIFTSFMVDYIFTQPPYIATDVTLEFGVSDHAGLIANISQ